jgi:hypothetical protein
MTAYLTITCANKGCRAIYRAYAVTPPNAPITHCMYCAAPNPQVSQSHNTDIIDTLAQVYDKPIEVMELLLKAYTHQVAATMSFHKLVTGEW